MNAPLHRRSSRRWAALPIFLLAFAVLRSARLEAQIPLSMVVDLAQRNSSSVKLADADLRKATVALDQSKDVYIPNLVMGSSIGPPSIGFTFSQPSIASATMQSLFFSYSQRRYIEAAREGIEAASLNLKDAREQAALDASTAYLELDTVSRELLTAQQQAEYSDRLVQIEQERQAAGVDPMSDVLQARLTLAQLKLKRIHLQSRATTLIGQLAALTGLSAPAIQTDHASIPEIPAVSANEPPGANPLTTAGVEAARAQAASRERQAKGDYLATRYWPIISFGAQYNRDATSLNNYNTYFSAKKKFKADNFNAGFNIQIPLFDLAHRDKSRESAAEALRATVEAEQAQRQNDVQIATLIGNLRELEAMAEVASLKQQIAGEQLKSVQTSMVSGNGAGPEPGATPQQSPKAEQLALIDERQKAMDAMDSGFDLAKVRLSLLRALGHMDDWLREVGPSPKPEANRQAVAGR
jgi:outer membrane protein TolC